MHTVLHLHYSGVRNRTEQLPGLVKQCGFSATTQTNMMECFLKVKGEDKVAEEGGDRLAFHQREVGTWINMRKMALFLTRTINK